MILITSMGGCASTSVIGWASKRIKCNCPLNSEGISRAGPGSNPRGLKHRISPPLQSDPQLSRVNSFDRGDINEGPIKRAVFLYDSPYSMILSLFRRNIAMGHAMAVTGNKPSHLNNLESFLERGEDTFGFYNQFKNWSDKDVNCDYERVLVKFDSLWENLDYLLGYMSIPKSEGRFFLKKQQRVNRMENLTQLQKTKLISIYGELDDQMKKMEGIVVL
jgi:hypothetical protein